MTQSSRLQAIQDAAITYGERSFDNYAQIRSIAETIRDGFCNWLDDKNEMKKINNAITK